MSKNFKIKAILIFVIIGASSSINAMDFDDNFLLEIKPEPIESSELWKSIRFHEKSSLFQNIEILCKNKQGFWRPTEYGEPYYGYYYRYKIFGVSYKFLENDLVVLKDRHNNPGNKAMFWKDAEKIMKAEDAEKLEHQKQDREKMRVERELFESQRPDLDLEKCTYKGKEYHLIGDFSLGQDFKFYYSDHEYERLRSQGACERIIKILADKQKILVEEEFRRKKFAKEREEYNKPENIRQRQQEERREQEQRAKRDKIERLKRDAREINWNDAPAVKYDKTWEIGDYSNYELNSYFNK